MRFERLSPLTGELVSSAAAMTAAEMPAIAARATDEGGVGGSGYGRFGGRRGIDSFTETPWITIDTQPGHFPI